MKKFKDFIIENNIHGFKVGDKHTLKSGNKVTIERTDHKIGFSWKDKSGHRIYDELDAKHDQPTLLHKMHIRVISGPNEKSKLKNYKSSSPSSYSNTDVDQHYLSLLNQQS
jgi:hypothetical protein